MQLKAVSMKPRDITPKAKEFIDSFNRGIEKLVHLNGIPPGAAVTAISNLNFHGQDIPADIFKRIDYGLKPDPPDIYIVLGEAMKTVSNGMVNIDGPVRVVVSNFILQYNLVRGYRPMRAAKKDDVKLDQRFNDGVGAFSYLDPVCKIEKFGSLRYGSDMTVDFLFNRYPFAPYHFIWVPNRENRHNQFLDPKKDAAVMETAWNYVTGEKMGDSIRLGYNSLGAHASVNHLHFQGFFVTEEWEPPLLPGYLEGTIWISKSDGLKVLEEFIVEMNDRYAKGESIAYNLCLTPQGTACFPRKHQGDKGYFTLLQKAQFTTGFAFSEMLGEIICPLKNISAFSLKDIEMAIGDIFKSLSLPPKVV